MKNEIIKKNITSDSENYKPKHDRSFKVILFSVLIFFIGLVLCVALYPKTLISFFELSKFMMVFAFIGFLIPLRYYRKGFHFVKYEMIIFNIIGIAPFLTGMFLLLNYTFISSSFTHQYRIEKIYFEGKTEYLSIGVVLENNFFSGERKIVELKDVTADEIIRKKYLKITISEGLFGYQVIKEKLLMKELMK